MHILIAEDDAIQRGVLVNLVSKWGNPVHAVEDGIAARQWLMQKNEPVVVLMDWNMPGLDGINVIRNIRHDKKLAYVILLTCRACPEDRVQGLKAGADDYIIKPFHPGELRARVNVGIRTLALQVRLSAQIGKLRETMDRVRRLQGLLPICAYCKRIRDDRNYWHQVELYISQHSDVTFTHGICPECLHQLKVPGRLAKRTQTA